MTRKDYILIAEALRARVNISSIVGSERTTVLSTTLMIAEALANDNPHFNREHFMAVIQGQKDLNSGPAR